MKQWHFQRLRVGGLATGMIFFFAAVGAAQVFRLGDWEGAYETVTEYSRQDIGTGSSQRSRFQDVLAQNRLSLRNVGAYIYDPQLINLSFGGTVGFSQDWRRGETGNELRQGTLLGYDLFTGILPEQSFSLNLFANRNQSLLSGGLAGRIDVVTENRGATFFARRLYIPSTLTFRQELQGDESRIAGITARRKEQRNIFTYLGERGWLDSEMSLRYEFVDASDDIFPRLSYQSHDGSLFYRLDFGPELNRHWDSRLHFFTRTGLTDLTTLSVDELLRSDHTERFWTDYRYFFTRTDTVGGATTTHMAAFGVNHRLYESLTTRLGLDNTFQTLPGGQKEMARSSLDFDYTKRLPLDGRLNASLGGRVRYEDNRFRTTESFVPQETHTFATPFTLPIALQNPLVATSSVVVTKVALGPLPVGCVAPSGPLIPLVLGRDYTLRTVGDITEIVPIPCVGTTPGINPGDTITVDYRFSVSPSLAFFTVPWHFNLSVDYRWIRPYFVHDQTDQSLVSGRDGQFLEDRLSDTLGIELRYDGQRLHANLTGEGSRFTSRRIAYNMVRSNQFLGYSILPELTLTLSADQALFYFLRPDRETRTFAGRTTLTYVLGATLFADAFAGIHALLDTSVPSERITETGLRLRWMYRRVEVLPSFVFFDRRRGDTDSKDFRVTLRIIRRF